MSNKKQEKIYQRKKSLMNWVVFLFVISIVIISLISVVFPAIIASNDSTFNELRKLGIIPVEVDSFTLGVWAVPLFIVNFVVFTITILYFKKKLPTLILRSIDYVFSFEISKKVTIITISILLAIYIVGNVEELTIVEEWEDYPGVKQRVDNWSPDQVIKGLEPHVRYFLIWSSINLFGYYTIIPFVASTSLLILTYLFTAEITKKRFAGIVSLVMLLQSNIFLTYNTTVSYTNFWTLFYLLSLYLVYKAWPLSPVSYLLSILSKALNAMFLPMSLYFLYRTKISKKKKIIVATSSVGIILIGLIAALVLDVNLAGGTGKQEEFVSDEFWLGFTSFSFQLRFDGLILLFIFPLMIGLFIASRKGILHADSIMVLIGGMLFTAPLLTGFTEQTNQPYRFMPFVVFFSIGVGVLLSKRKT